MADEHHDSALDQAVLSAFLRELRGNRRNEDVAKAAGVPHTSLQKWFRTKPGRMEAINFLRVVMALHGEKALLDAIREWRAKYVYAHDDKGFMYDFAEGATRGTLKVADREAPAYPEAALEPVAIAKPRSHKKKKGRRP